MSLITASQYWKEVGLTATRVIAHTHDASEGGDLMEVITDVLHNVIGDHKWIVYDVYNLGVIQYSENVDHYIDNFGADAAAEELKARGLTGLHTTIAFWAMYADVYNKVIDQLDD